MARKNAIQADPRLVYNKNKKIKGAVSTRVTTVIIYIVVGALGVLAVLPFLYVFGGSFATEKELYERPFLIIPSEFSINAYKFILEDGRILNGLKNTVIVTLIGTAVSMVFSTTFAYPLSKSDFRGRNLILNLVIITMVFSGGMIPTFLLIKNLKMLDSFAALTIPGAISAFNMVIIKNFFEGVPSEL